jgi:hypothetical protein
MSDIAMKTSPVAASEEDEEAYKELANAWNEAGPEARQRFAEFLFSDGERILIRRKSD